MKIRRLHSESHGFAQELAALTAFDADAVAADAVAADILAQVRAGGDAAVVELTNRFDGVGCDTMHELILDADEFRQEFAGLPNAERLAL